MLAGVQRQRDAGSPRQLAPPHAGTVHHHIGSDMAGRAPGECDAELAKQPGTEKCIALVYEGIDAVRKIRDVLGPTDPSKAPPGSIRREFGQTIMVNAAHASDSEESAQREFKIVNVGENNFRREIDAFYAKA